MTGENKALHSNAVNRARERGCSWSFRLYWSPLVKYHGHGRFAHVYARVAVSTLG